MAYCGMDTGRVDDIPFGVRAIQQGVEVDGIWISHSVSGNGSQAASSATLPGDEGDHVAGKGKTPERRLREGSTCKSNSSGTIDEPPHPAPHHVPATIRDRYLAQSDLDPSELQETVATPLTWHLDSYIPSGTSLRLLSGPQHRIPATAETQTSEPGESVVYGAARIYANRDFRRLNMGFEVLPAGALGARRELGDGSDVSAGSRHAQRYKDPKHTEPRRGRLRKMAPVPHLRPEG